MSKHFFIPFKLWPLTFLHFSQLGALDSLESFELESEKLQNFALYDKISEESKRISNDWKFRLPWPLFDITTVKIPIEWLPKKCLQSYLRRKAMVEMKNLKF